MAVIKGVIRNATVQDTVRVGYRLGEKFSGAKAAVNEAGEFTLRLTNLTAPLDAQLIFGAFETIYISPGDSLQLTADKKDLLGTLRFSGRGAAANNYLTQAQRQFDANYDSWPESRPSAATATPTEFRLLVDTYRQQQLDTLVAYQARESLPAGLLASRRLVLDMQHGRSLLRYASMLKRRTQKEPELPAHYFDFLATLPLREKPMQTAEISLVESLGWLIEAYHYVRLLPPNGQLPGKAGSAEQIYTQATADFGDTPARDYVVGGLLTNQLYDFRDTGRPAVLAALPVFLAHNRDSTTARNLRQALQATATLQRGNLAPEFSLRDASGKTVALQDFRGKVVYLDFWYSACKPCLAEAPAAVPLKKRFLGREVVFLYISVDQNPETWRRTLKKYPLTGANSVHLLDAKGDKAAKAFQVGSFPNYWIIGRNGRIWQNSAPRPSSGSEVVAALEKALAEKP
jgi:peroxiredoxin